jgi:hypothetical protein
MKSRTSFALAVVATGALGFAAGAYVRAQSPPLDPLLEQKRAISQILVQGDRRFVTSKMLSDSVMLGIFQSDHGDYRARLFVKLGERWEPVAADGLEDMKGFLPARPR